MAKFIFSVIAGVFLITGVTQLQGKALVNGNMKVGDLGVQFRVGPPP